jgi:hypothetical protein
VESVGFQLLSLRQSFRDQRSPLDFERAEIATNGGPSRENLRTAVSWSGPEILSLDPFVSKPPDYADLVWFS